MLKEVLPQSITASWSSNPYILSEENETSKTERLMTIHFESAVYNLKMSEVDLSSESKL